ncbi:SDR family oxidoreductase [Wenzhouxiangella sp. XN24]|uniref:SDR family oxidoreductase n=1 Tax=Wenzhouxiangella sp. XN24 TaxID=2713569 RepID=UPI0013E9B9B2|nr:SDR family oxidoreductase [Wenzhouxiangella sp. XN24]NGX15027.1 SDR family oxidoreductase [Wenzhouxiangella sp. XN24]
MTIGNAGNGRRPRPPFDPQDTQGQPGIEAKLDPRPQYSGRDYKAAGKLEGEVALITGGDSGIGRAVAVLFAREGADVAILCLPEEKTDADETLQAIEAAGRRGLVMTGDIREYAFCQEAVRQVVAHFGRINILVNNAAYQQHVESLDELSIEQWDRTFRTNIYGYFYMAKAVASHLDHGDCIINTGSVTGLQGSPGLLDYSATKGAIHTFTKSLAANLVKRGVRVNCVAPGPVWTPLNPAERSDEEIEEFGARVPFGRPAQPEEIAPAFVYLASRADSGYVTGETIALLGGEITAGS